MTSTKDQILTALRTFSRQRPGLDFSNYGDVTAYRAEVRRISADLRDANQLLRAVELASLMPVETLLGGFRAYGGRLACEIKDRRVHLEYTTGQYWPTEYRRAVCAVAAQALWDHYRDDFAASAKAGESAGDAIRRNFRRLFGLRISRRWFN